MATRKQRPPPKQAEFTPEELQTAIRLLRRRLSEVESFHPSDEAEKTRVEVAIDATLERVFGKDSSDYQRYSRASKFDWGPISMGGEVFSGGSGLEDRTRYIQEGRTESIQLLKTAINLLEERAEETPAIEVSVEGASQTIRPVTDKVFVVHGHDTEVRESVARLLEKLELDPVILDEKPNEGQTIVEKFETHGDVGYAIVLLTPDDVGGENAQQLKSRPRQNVVLELGYFVGALTRKRVCALVRKPIELPSDIHGLVWIEWHSDWKIRLAKELRAAGFSIDMNKL